MKDWGEPQQISARILMVGSCIISSLGSQWELPAVGEEITVNPVASFSPSPNLDAHNSLAIASWDNLPVASPEFTGGLQQVEFSPPSPIIPPVNSSDIFISQQIAETSALEPVSSQGMENLPSVSELSDVKPTDWAYQALKSLVERYRVIAGDANRKFRGNQALTRYEYAAALAATFSAVQDLLAGAIEDEYVRQDAIIVQRLRQEFGKNLEDLEKRIDSTEIRAAQIQADQFSTTTKLKAQTIAAATVGNNANRTIIARSRLTLTSSFQGRDQLITELEAGNNGNDAIGQEQAEEIDLLGSQGIFADASGLKYTQFPSDLRLRKLAYTFRPRPEIAVTVGAKLSPRDFIDKNTYGNNEALDFSSGLFLNNPLIVQNPIDRVGGAGVAVDWTPPNSKFAARGLYIAGSANNPDGASDQGLFGDNRQTSLEVEFQPLEPLKLRLQYTNALVNNTDINALGVNAEYALNRNTGIFGRVGIGKYEGFNTTLNRDFDAHPLSWSLGIGLRNIVIPATLAGVAVGQPFVTGDVGNATQTNFEAFYNLQLSDNVSVTPIFSIVINPDNDSSNGMIWQSTFRTVFSF